VHHGHGGELRRLLVRAPALEQAIAHNIVRRLDVPHRVNHLAVCQQLSVVVAAVDTRDDAVDVSPDVNGLCMTYPR
jgi:hypothetical protein